MHKTLREWIFVRFVRLLVLRLPYEIVKTALLLLMFRGTANFINNKQRQNIIIPNHMYRLYSHLSPTQKFKPHEKCTF